MGFRFRRSVRIAPGLRVNFGKKGMSLSAGRRGATVTFGKNGVYGNVGIPGSGLSYRGKLSGSNIQKQKRTTVETSVPVSLRIDDDGTTTLLDSYGNILPSKYIKTLRDQKPELIDGFLNKACSKINDDISEILNIHLSTPSMDDFIEYVPQEYGENYPEEPLHEKYSFFERLFPFLRKSKDQKNEEKKSNYIDLIKAWDAAKLEFDSNEARYKYLISEARYESIEGMSDYYEVVLERLGWPRETLVNFDILDEGRLVVLDVDLPEIEDFPSSYAEVSSTGIRVNIKRKSETQIRKEYMTHVHGVGFRLAGATFASLPKAEQVIVSGYSQRLSAITAHVSDEYLYSVRVDKENWARINHENLSAVDPVECLGSFDMVRKMTKTGIFKPIDPHSI